MAHQRKLIRNAIVALLAAANTSAAGRVYNTRVDPLRRNELPAISVFVLHEDVDAGSAETAPIELTRVAKVEISAWVQDTQAVSAADTMDDLAEQIEAAMASDYYLTIPLAISAIDHTTGRVTIPGHGLTTAGSPLALEAGIGGILPVGLPRGDLWAIVVDANTVQLASSLEDALAGFPLHITDDGTAPLRARVGTVIDQMLESTDAELAELDGKSDPLVGIIALTYSVTYRTRPAAAAAQDDFLTADAKQQLVGGVGDTAIVEDIITVRTS